MDDVGDTTPPTGPRLPVPVRSVFHNGELVNGRVIDSRSLSTGVDRIAVEALDRDGRLHQFDIPESVFQQWEIDGLVQRFRDLDATTGVFNEELRFDGSLAEQLNNFLVQ